MPEQYYIEELRTLCNNRLTITVAHDSYLTSKKVEQYNCPLYLLTPFLPSFYRIPFQEKEKIIVFSPDDNEYKIEVMKKIRNELPDYKIKIVKNMTLEEYKHLISKAMFTVTFGEGYDGYFIEPYLSDSISFAVHNTTFFPRTFKKVPTVYETWTDLLEKITYDIRSYENNNFLYEAISNDVENEIQRFTNNRQSNLDLYEFYQRFSEDHVHLN